jgi:hypothetical protein
MAANAVNQFSGVIVAAAFSGGLGYISARIFTSIDPMYGGVYGIVSALVSKVTGPLFDKIFAHQGADANSKCVGNILNTLTGIAVSLAICGALGFEMTFGTACALIASQLAGALLGICCLGACVLNA